VQSLYYGLTIRAGDRRPQPGSPRHGNHRRRIHIIVILAYLLYTIYEAYHQMRMQGDFYQSLDVSHDVDDKGIKSRFRRLHVRTSLRWTPTNVVSRAALHHPDKVGASKSPAASEAYFVHLKLAQDTLLNPAKRFAYDRFGPDMLEWRHCTTIRDYIAAGFTAFAPSYLASGFLLVVLSVTGYLQWGRFVTCYALISNRLLISSVALSHIHGSCRSRALHPHASLPDTPPCERTESGPNFPPYSATPPIPASCSRPQSDSGGSRCPRTTRATSRQPCCSCTIKPGCRATCTAISSGANSPCYRCRNNQIASVGDGANGGG
jgi:hypothetical protein